MANTLSKIPAAVLKSIGLPTKEVSTSKIGVTAGSSDRTAASVQPLNATQSDLLSQYSTYLTKNDGVTYLLYQADRRWSKVTLILESTGPVAVGDKSNLGSVTSGQGILLQTNVPRTFTIGKGSQLYIAATAVSRVNIAIEPFAWQEQIAAFIAKIISILPGSAQ